jgi:hypothetical protein
MAATTASTMSDPTYAIAAGNTPATIVSSARATVRTELVLQTSSTARRL